MILLPYTAFKERRALLENAKKEEHTARRREYYRSEKATRKRLALKQEQQRVRSLPERKRAERLAELFITMFNK